METRVQVLSDAERATIHERTLDVLGRVGVRVDTARGRALLGAAGAEVDDGTAVVRFPRALVEASLAAAPSQVRLTGRRPGWSLGLGEGECSLVADGEATFVWDAATATRRPSTHDDWRTATQLLDALDEVGVYWRMVEAGLPGSDPGDAVHHWHEAYAEFSKHIQDAALTPDEGRWLIEVLDVVAGGRDAFRAAPSFSFLLCPHSPLVIEGPYTDAYLETVGWRIPVAVMPMPLMGLTSPASLVSTAVTGNAEVLAMLCLVQAADPGTPFIYAPALAVMEPRSGRFGGGAAELALLGAATTEMARHYGLPVEASAGGTDHHVPGIQAAFERALGWTLPALAWPDLLVGPGLLGGSLVLSLEQLLLDVEVFRRLRRLHRGVGSPSALTEARLQDEIEPGVSFVASTATRDALRAGEWQVSDLGVHGTFESWDEAGRPELLEEVRERASSLVGAHRPLPLDPAVERELERIESRAHASVGRAPAGQPETAR